MKTIYFSLAALTLLTACGGGGGGGGSKNPVPTSTTTSSVVSSLAESSVSSAQSSSTASMDSAGIVFADSLNSEWGSFTRYEVGTAIEDYTDQTGDYLLYWAEKNIGGEHGNVVELRYSSKQASIAAFEITGNKDLSAYATGTLSFDIRVVPQATPSANDAQLPIEMQYQVECFWPCTSQSNYVSLTDYSEWKTVQINAADLIKSGLDISAVVKSLTLRPVKGNLTNATFEIDNIQWKKGTDPVVQRDPVFLAAFNDYNDVGDWAIIDTDSGYLPSGLTISTSYGIQIGTGTGVKNLTLTRTLDAPINTSGKHVGAIFRAGDALTATGAITFKLIDSHQNSASTPSVALNNVAIERPYSFSYSIDDELVSDAGFDPENVTQIIAVISFPSSSLSETKGSSNFFSIDEIVIE